MQQSVKITKVFRGKQMTKFGEMDKVGLKTEQHGDIWVSGMFNPKKGPNGTENWKEGDTVEIYIEEKNGFVNFSLKPKAPSTGADTSALEARIKKLEDKVFGVTVARTSADDLVDELNAPVILDDGYQM